MANEGSRVRVLCNLIMGWPTMACPWANQPCQLIYLLSITSFTPWQQSGIVERLSGLQYLKCLLSDLNRKSLTGMELDGLNWSFWDSLQSIFPLNFKPDHPSLNGSISSVDKILQSNKSFASPSKIQILFI